VCGASWPGSAHHPREASTCHAQSRGRLEWASGALKRGALSWLGPLVGPSRTLGAVSEGAVLGRSGAKLSNLYASSGVVSGVVNRRYCMRYWFCSARALCGDWSRKYTLMCDTCVRHGACVKVRGEQ
jgi:hypothetical protein